MAARNLLNALIEAGDRAGLAEALRSADRKALNTRGHNGRTPLACAAFAPRADAEMLRMLLGAGARMVLPDVLQAALNGGDPAKARTLLEAGASATYRDEHGNDALIDAAFGRDIRADARLMELLALLIDAGAAPGGETRYGETAMRVLSRNARFDAVTLLLDAGADAAPLGFSPLHQAVAFGALADVETALAGADIEARDDWGRTPWLLAVLRGDAAKTARLEAAGADIFATGSGETPALHYALQSRRLPMLEKLLADGHDPSSRNAHGDSALLLAVEDDWAEAVDLLLRAGADIEHENFGRSALSAAGSHAIARRLLEGGADPKRLSNASRRALLGLPPEPAASLLATVSTKHFQRAALPRPGHANPEEMHEPFLDAMLRAGVNASQARNWFEEEHAPVWCAERFGQTATLLPDGRVVLIAGEHEDWYDLDFCIYNDVIVRETDGRLRIFFYPHGVFPPTDFHTATLVGEAIYVIGSLGYKDERDYGGPTPVYRLDLTDMRFTPVSASGESPGWLNRHSARLITPSEIEISGGLISLGPREPELNDRVYVFDVARSVWRVT